VQPLILERYLAVCFDNYMPTKWQGRKTFYGIAIIGLVAVWNSVFLIHSSLAENIWPYKIFRATDYFFAGRIADSDPWIRYPDILYYLVAPLVILAASCGFAVMYRREHPVNVTLIVLLALLQTIMSAITYHVYLGWYA
jgi:hypothetical protein